MISLAVKYRPKTFEDVVCQTSIVKILKRQIELKEFKNAYLFAGSSGCGKTTVGRIFASLINEGKGTPIEIDGASNNGVDNVKSIIKSAAERAIDSKYKVYLIDECHALSNQAWQAFLKCIEEPPTYTIFIFCTTDAQKIPATILNRVQRYNFTRIPSSSIANRLRYICEQEGFTNYDSACEYISRICNGGMRDGISLLDKCSSYSTDITLENVLLCLGHFSYKLLFNLLNFMIDGNEQAVVQTLNDVYNDGADLKLFVEEFFSFCLDVSKYLIFNSFDIIKIPKEMESDLQTAINFDTAKSYYNYLIDKLLEIKMAIKNDTNIKDTIDVYMLRITRCQ